MGPLWYDGARRPRSGEPFAAADLPAPCVSAKPRRHLGNRVRSNDPRLPLRSRGVDPLADRPITQRRPVASAGRHPIPDSPRAGNDQSGRIRWSLTASIKIAAGSVRRCSGVAALAGARSAHPPAGPFHAGRTSIHVGGRPSGRRTRRPYPGHRTHQISIISLRYRHSDLRHPSGAAA